jgi:hypothetical protein
MPLDHYISQVHLRNFYSPITKKLFAVSKKSLRKFPCSSRDVCRIEDGSTNAYLVNDRAIEDFLKGIEPRYNSAVAALRNGTLNPDTVYVIAGFIAYVVSCSPTAMRLNSHPLREAVEAAAKIIEAKGKMPPPPKSLGADSLAQLFETGKVKVAIDHKYPQAVGIANVIDRISTFGNSRWEVIINEHAAHNPFFTSDFPAAIETGPDPRVLNRVIPLAPDVALRISPDIELRRGNDLDFRRLRFRTSRPKPADIRALNKLIVQCAEEIVFFRDDLYWVPELVARNRKFRIEAITDTIRTGSGYAICASQRIGERVLS